VKTQSETILQEVVSEFIHKLSHDITGILQNIMGYTTLLGEEYDKTYLEGIARLTTKLSTRMKTAVSDVDNGELSKKK
jgi:signal transduction histidine kinase